MKHLFSLTLFILSVVTHAQSVLSGTITGNNGEPLVGASIISLGTQKGVSTNANGQFEIRLVNGERIIEIQYLGYKSLMDTITITQDQTIDYSLKLNPFLSDEFVVEATRVNRQSPFAFENVSKDDIEQVNLGQDLPILLNQTISAVTTSDAGAGVGYTGIRIRGSDATRINVTVNGVPLNDAESHGVFWVNMPDFASTTNNIQIQRGVGTSSNGAASFGASINLETSGFDSVSFVEINNSYGSFNTHRHNAIFNTGLISDHFNFEGRLSYIESDGYIDRSASQLKSYYAAGGYFSKKFMLKAVVFGGNEITQQAWWGTPESRIENDDAAMLEHAANNGLTESQTENLLTSGRTYNYYTYQNEIDNYSQTHYQLITGYQLSDNLYLNVTGHYTRGLGYFEQSKPQSDFVDFGLDNPVIGTDTFTITDFVVRRWLDNHFYGGVYSLVLNKGLFDISLGGSYNEYVGDHYGEIIWSELATTFEKDARYYFSDSKKRDISNYVKSELRLDRWLFYGDIQYRYIDYQSQGIDNDQRSIRINEHYNFVNPKMGVSFFPNSSHHVYASLSRGSREPVRSDFTDAIAGSVPKPEYLTDGELGWSFSSRWFTSTLNAYYMYYQDQLVLTGEVNDVGSPVRTNVDESYRAGIEMMARIGLDDGLYWRPNLTLSQNRIVSFSETLYDYTAGFDVVTVKHANSNIAFSPSFVSGSELGYLTDFGLHVALLTKYVGKQYLDNTSNENRAINPYWTNDLLIRYQLNSRHWKNLELSLLVNNALNHEYESNGYTYSYVFGSLITENFYYPQAGINWLGGIKWRF